MPGETGLTKRLSDDQFAAAQFRALLDSSPQGIIEVDSNGNIWLANRQAEKIFGYLPGQLLGRSIEVLVPEHLREIHTEERTEYSSCPRPRSMGIGMELKGRRSDGTEVPIEISLSHVQNEEQDMVIAMISDVTERLELEEHARQSRKMAAVAQLAGGLSHRLNNLLTVISGYASLMLEDGQSREDSASSLKEISKAAHQAASLTWQLWSISGNKPVEAAWFDPNRRIRQMQDHLGRLAGKFIELQLVLGEDLGEILADPQQFDQVLINLVQNGYDAMPDGGRLTIQTSAAEAGEECAHWHLPPNPGHHIMLTVTDTGIGMTPEVQSRMFEPFYTTKPASQGGGLGLAVTYGILKESGGTIFASSEPNQGSRFHVMLPRAVDV